MIGWADARFLFNESIHNPLSNLLQQSLKGQQYERELIRLEHQLTLKIHEFPELLSIFFDPNSAKSKSHQFPLFDHLVSYCHLEGELGDIARSSCSLLLQLAEKEMETFIEQHEFGMIIVASLCGLFSNLPPTLPGPSTSSYRRDTFENDIRAFEDFYTFIQDIVDKCPSESIKSYVLNEVNKMFYMNVISTALVKGSDFDGTALAAVYYTQLVFDQTTNTTLSRFLTRTLLDSKEEECDVSDVKLRPRDIIISKLHSLSEDIVTATLLLLDSLLESQQEFALHLLLEKLPVSTDVVHSHIDVQDHLRLVARYFALLPKKMEGEGSTLDSYLIDAEKVLRKSGPILLNQPVPTPEQKAVSLQGRIAATIRLSTDHTLYKILSLFSLFFNHSMKVNVALSGVLNRLASFPSQVLYNCLFDIDTIINNGDGAQSFYTILVKLLEQVESYRLTMPDFEARLCDVRRDLMKPKLEEWRMPFSKLFKAAPDPTRNDFCNVVLLEEFLKELIACLVMRGASDFDRITYL
jgi:Retinoic acid induced 16-like protein/Family of unknown function (DUF5917)